jgi:hypothetical protein
MMMMMMMMMMFPHDNSNVPLMEQVFDMGGIMDVWSLITDTPQSLNYDAVNMTDISSNPYCTWGSAPRSSGVCSNIALPQRVRHEQTQNRSRSRSNV